MLAVTAEAIAAAMSRSLEARPTPIGMASTRNGRLMHTGTRATTVEDEPEFTRTHCPGDHLGLDADCVAPLDE